MGLNLGPRSRLRERIALGVCVLASLTLLALPVPNKLGVARVVSAVSTDPWQRAADTLRDILTLRGENADLKARLTAAELDAAAADRIRRERDSLRGALGLHLQAEGRLRPCTVMRLGLSEASTRIRIVSPDSLDWKIHQPVIDTDGLVGRVDEIVDARTAWVELVSAPDFALCCQIERNGLLGILRPSAGRYRLTMVGRDEDVLPGDAIVTSDVPVFDGPGDVVAAAMPRGLPVGVVDDVVPSSQQIFKQIEVELRARLGDLDVVFVVEGEGDWLGGGVDAAAAPTEGEDA